MQQYIVLVDALGYAGGCARLDEVVSSTEVGSENVERLVRDGIIAPLGLPLTVVEVAPNDTEPTSLADRLALGLLPSGDLTSDELEWLSDVQSGVATLRFDSESLIRLNVKDLKARLDAFGAELPPSGRKADMVAALKSAVGEFVYTCGDSTDSD